jgi:ABC-type lipoprotein export system ATPase subunit
MALLELLRDAGCALVIASHDPRVRAYCDSDITL